MLAITAPEIKTVAIRDGIRLPFVEQGEPDGVPVLFLHGYSDSWRSFEEVLPFLPPRIRAIALTQRGHGDADRPLAGYGADDFAADLASFMDALGIASAVIVGHCLGGHTAQRFAIDYPERVRGLVLAASYPTAADNAGIAELLNEIATFTDPVDPDFVRAFQESTVAGPVSAAFLDMVIGESCKLPAQVWRACAAALATDDHSARLAGIAVPALVLWGERDETFPRAEQERLLAGLPEARFTVYAGVGHALHWEAPRRFADDVVAYVDSRV
jgi:pimeloyl-ACP methyl ester carboxylesterase